MAGFGHESAMMADDGTDRAGANRRVADGDGRRQREAAALRENLRKRKAQARQRSAESPATESGEAGPPDPGRD